MLPAEQRGRTLQPSRKASQSAPHLLPSAAYSHAQSAPLSPDVTPPPPKSVHFPERSEDLQHVRVFQAPIAFTGVVDETAEAEVYHPSVSQLSRAGRARFPHLSRRAPRTVADASVVLDAEVSSIVPAPAACTAAAAGTAHVLLESLRLSRSHSDTLCGTALVRNVALTKTVSVRFSLDAWHTAGEVRARYAAAVPALPPPFREPQPPAGGWERRTFVIRLEDAADKTLWLAVRFVAHGEPGGEWWDDNAGANYRIVFRRSPTAATPSPQRPARPQPQPLRLRSDTAPPPAVHLPSPPDSTAGSPTISAGYPLTPGAPDGSAQGAQHLVNPQRAALSRE